MYHFMNVFDMYGIYTLNEYNNTINDINDLRKMIKNNKTCQYVFNKMSIIPDFNAEHKKQLF